MGRGRVETVERDRGYKRLMSELEKMKKATGKGPYVKVGVLEDAGTHKDTPGTTVAEVALWNEFGTGKIPERSFLRSTADAIRPKVADMFKKFSGKIIDGKMSPAEALELVGMFVQAAIKKTINEMKSPPNAPATIRAKARKAGRMKLDRARGKGEAEYQAALDSYNNPLVDTGQLRESIHYKVVK